MKLCPTDINEKRPSPKTWSFLAGMAGFEPTNDGVKVRCLTAWLHPYKWGGRSESNRRPPGPQSGALTD